MCINPKNLSIYITIYLSIKPFSPLFIYLFSIPLLWMIHPCFLPLLTYLCPK